ncbi:MAG: Nif3-like dinuclear metal center hexameric protein [Acidimicrobiales bacterium]
MDVAEFVARLAARTHPERAAAWDAVGLQVGDPAAPVRAVTVVHEVTEAVTLRLEAEPVDLVVAYHPLLFRPAARLVPGGGAAGRAVRLLRAGVAVVVTHSDFDAMPGGMSDAMADALGLTDVTGFAPVAGADQVKIVTFVPAASVAPLTEALSSAGAGQIGDYAQCAFTVDGVGRFFAGDTTNPAAGRAGALNSEPEVRVEMVAPRTRADAVIEALIAAHPYEEPAFDVYPVASNHPLGGRIGNYDSGWDDLVAAATEQFQPEGLRTARVDGVVPHRVAVSPGAGESRIVPAATAGADVLVSGDISHHRMAGANDRGLSVIDPGHAASERPGIARLQALVGELCDDGVDHITVGPM